MSIGKVYEILSKGLSNKKGDKMNHKNVYESIIEILKYN